MPALFVNDIFRLVIPSNAAANCYDHDDHDDDDDDDDDDDNHNNYNDSDQIQMNADGVLWVLQCRPHESSSDEVCCLIHSFIRLACTDAPLYDLMGIRQDQSS